MTDAAGMGELIATAKLVRQIGEDECRRRNALSRTVPGFTLKPGQIGNVLEKFGEGEAFLVEFGPKANSCDWLGVLYSSELELVSSADIPAARIVRAA
ncbi:MAG TPA: hypothetical protein PK264_00595 [Hyphomicrobiaceae bacterium]|nr:hypothetical protein [Hyphomicrobiaceae bacterium]